MFAIGEIYITSLNSLNTIAIYIGKVALLSLPIFYIPIQTRPVSRQREQKPHHHQHRHHCDVFFVAPFARPAANVRNIRRVVICLHKCLYRSPMKCEWSAAIVIPFFNWTSCRTSCRFKMFALLKTQFGFGCMMIIIVFAIAADVFVCALAFVIHLQFSG